MTSASPRRSRTAVAVTYALAFSLFVSLLPLQAPAATLQTDEAGARASQEKSSPAGQQSHRARSPLAESPVLQEFKQWVEQYKVGGLVAASEEEGVELSAERRSIMAKLVEEDPESALEF